MKPKLIRILFSFSLMAFSVFYGKQLRAQDSAGPADTYEANDEKEREPLYSTGEPIEHHKSSSPTLAKDSAAIAPKMVAQQRSIKPATENVKPESKQPADDSILSFNFLYYIIQKYKLQDIVD
jgi:hypothetical protein